MIAPALEGARCAPTDAVAKFATDHLSHSQIQSYLLCPRKWTYEKIEHAPKERVGSALVFGIALHDACAAANEAALTGEGYNAAVGFVSAWKLAIEQAGVPIHYGKDGADDLLAKGRALAAAYTPPSGIIGVEQPFEVLLHEDLPPIHGRIDLIRRTETGDLAIADLKSSSSRLLTETDAVEAQISLYNEAYPAARHEVIVLAKTKVPTVTIQAITPWPRHHLVRQYQEVHHAMQAGVRFANRGWQCDGCQFADRCKKEG